MKEFNITGLCIPSMHYLVDIGEKLEKIQAKIDKGKYFTINRGRQYGKTTTLSQIYQRLNKKYLVLRISFEAIGDAFSTMEEFSTAFIRLVTRELERENVDQKIITAWKEDKEKVDKIDKLSEKITELCKSVEKEVVLLIDEVDKSSNNQLFLYFLGMLRNKYLDRNDGRDQTFKSVILASVYDVKNLKLKLREGAEIKLNSPWNIAEDFKVDMSFSAEEISTMLLDYEKEHPINMNIIQISQELYKYTSGYPFLVSKLCKTVEEDLGAKWTIESIQEAVKRLLIEKNTLFDDLFKNLGNNKQLYNLMNRILLEKETKIYSLDTPEVELGLMFSILKVDRGNLVVANSIFEIRIYNYLIQKKRDEGSLDMNEYLYSQFITNNRLDMEHLLNKFSEFMYNEHRKADATFIEQNGRLLFLCFLKPIINGAGFYYVEPEIREDKRMDLIVTYGKEQFIIELKIWHGDKKQNDAYEQLAQHLDYKNMVKGYLITFNFNKNKEYTKEWITHKDKQIYSITV